MEIGTEISKKIRAAIKGKLQELGAYVDEELPDYIMVMVANKKTSQQMSDDLSLFLGNNTIKFTVWLHGVLEKLRSVAVEPASLRPQLYSDTGTSSGKSEWKGEESKGLAVSSSRSDRTEARVSSSAHEHRRVSSDKTLSRLTSTVKPLMDPPSSEAVIDIKPELDDDLIGEDPVDMGVLPGRLRGSTSGGGRASAQIYRPPQGRSSSGTGRSADAYRSSEGSSGSHSRQQHSSYHLDSRSSRDSRTYREGGSSRQQQQEEASRKRKAPVVSSVVRVNQAADGGRDSDDEEEDDDEEDEGYGVKNLSSRVSLPSKPERKPSLPPAKQANKNLLLRAMSEAQISINKTAAYLPIPQRQTVPVAPRTRSTTDEMNAAIQLVQEHLHGLVPRGQSYTPSEPQPPRQLVVQSRSLASRLQLDVPEDNMRAQHSDYLALEVAEGSVLKPFDTRSFIVRRPELEEELVPVRNRLGQLDRVPMTSRLGLEEMPPPMRSGLEEVVPPMRSRLGLEEVAPPMRSRREETTVPMRSRLGAMVKEEIQPATPRMVQPASEKAEAAGSASPKFIVTLDGVPSPLGNLGDCDMEADDSYPKPAKTTMPDPSIHLGTKPKLSIHHRLQGEPQYPDELGMETEEEEEEAGPVKRQKVLERCKFWPVCKSGDECVYHHPTTQCKTFPSCKFGDKCLFVHPNCKFDGKCSKPDCPFTHVSRRGPAPYTPPVRPVPPVQTSSVCRFFPECKKMDCLFYHPKPCRFGAQCKRTGCTFYHPTASVPPRHALKWTKAQSS
ncbi:zinc finger CCCH domain-containing protein 14 isoform X5 [Oncorhynchus kisutch]|uniref:zinc finger CCCH domain-containing protein 14 isoform X5 n=1 Tax=Oncorhynchus kisutch TaxID=8019 RepID=UPI0012DD122D|nr:zinc finger CCCH domain-containing protein 14 isoform X5 [Oncorhynchus kisutch]